MLMLKFLWEIFLLSQAGRKTEILLCGKFRDLCFLSKLIRKVRNQILMQNVISKYFSLIFGRKNRPVWVLQDTALWDVCHFCLQFQKPHHTAVNKCSHRDSAPHSMTSQIALQKTQCLCRQHLQPSRSRYTRLGGDSFPCRVICWALFWYLCKVEVCLLFTLWVLSPSTVITSPTHCVCSSDVQRKQQLTKGKGQALKISPVPWNKGYYKELSVSSSVECRHTHTAAPEAWIVQSCAAPVRLGAGGLLQHTLDWVREAEWGGLQLYMHQKKGVVVSSRWLHEVMLKG